MSVWSNMVGSAWGTTKNILLVVALVVSLAFNAASFTVNALSTAISTVIEAVTGVETVVSQVRRQKTELAITAEEASKWEGKAVGRGWTLRQVQAEKATLGTELAASRKLASKWEGAAIANAFALDQEKAARVALEVETVELRAARRVTYEGVEMAVPEAVTRATAKIKARTVKLAFADLSATGAQALPWIGAAAVVAATGYDLKMSCDTMRDMRAIEVAVNPAAENDLDVERVCGLRVPTEAEIWAAIKSSPGAVWDAAKVALDGLPSMPEMPELHWPSLPSC